MFKLFSFAAKVCFVVCSLTQLVLAEVNLRNFGPAPSFNAYTDDDRTVSEKDFENKYQVINFFFTNCEGPCPALMQYVQKLAQDFSTPNLSFLSFSVDPKFDKPAKLKEYRKKLGLEDSRINLLTNSEEEVFRLLNQGYKLGSGDTAIEHSTRFILVDRKGQIRALFEGSYNNLKELVSKLISEE